MLCRYVGLKVAQLSRALVQGVGCFNVASQCMHTPDAPLHLCFIHHMCARRSGGRLSICRDISSLALTSYWHVRDCTEGVLESVKLCLAAACLSRGVPSM
jgi:hypothetical protein